MIRSAIYRVTLIAMRQESSGVWGRFDNQRPSFGTRELLIIGGAILLLLLGWLLWQVVARRHRRVFWTNSDSRLFGELCRAHRLDHASRRLLKRLAATRNLKHTAAVFVEPEYFEATNIPPALKSSASELRQLRHKLFD